MWVFGYGSLMWKVDFPIETKMVGYIKGYKRRFYQHSIDHRGTPENPGRVVTLIPGDDNDRVYGIAYKIKKDDIPNVVKHLDHREKNGYDRVDLVFYPRDNEAESFKITLYLANNNNPSYAGPADNDTIANQIINCTGPSGSNVEYVCKLAKIMRETAPDVQDEHLYDIEGKVLKLLINQMNEFLVN